MNEKEKNPENSNPKQVIIPYGYAPCPPEADTIDLRELWQILKRRKKTIARTTIALFMLAILYLIIAKPVYEANASFQIGQIESKPIEKPIDLKFYLESIYHIGDKNTKREYPILDRVTVPKKSDRQIKLVAVGYDNKSAKKILEEIVGLILEKENTIINSYLSIKKRELRKSQILLKNLKEQIKRQDGILKELSGQIKEADQEALPAITLEYSKNLEKYDMLESRLLKLQEKISSLEMELSPVNIQPSKMIGSINTYDHPVKPKKLLILTVSLLTGLMLGIFLAFFLEFIKSEEKES